MIKNKDFSGGWIIYWDTINSNGCKELVEVSQWLTADWYLRNILVISYAGFLGFKIFVLTHANARGHTAYIIQQYFGEVNIWKMIWHTRNRDLTPIEHVWDMLK